jgi:pumilio family protein 6
MSFVSSELLGQCSSKVVAAYLESSDSKVKDLAKSELQPLVDGGKLKIPDHKAAEKK